jgi:hypothetical protein
VKKIVRSNRTPPGYGKRSALALARREGERKLTEWNALWDRAIFNADSRRSWLATLLAWLRGEL